MRLVHRYSGDCVGWLDGSHLFGLDGRHLGQLKGEEVYGPDARYLGEFRQERLITDVRKRTDRLWMSFPALACRKPPAAIASIKAALTMPQGCIDFPEPVAAEVFERVAA